MTAPKRGRTRASLSPALRADLEERESRVVWEPLIVFDREPCAHPADHGDQLYEVGPSLMDRDREGYLGVDYNRAWSGGLVVSLHDGRDLACAMIDRAQAFRLRDAIDAWEKGVVEGYREMAQAELDDQLAVWARSLPPDPAAQ